MKIDLIDFFSENKTNLITDSIKIQSRKIFLKTIKKKIEIRNHQPFMTEKKILEESRNISHLIRRKRKQNSFIL